MVQQAGAFVCIVFTIYHCKNTNIPKITVKLEKVYKPEYSTLFTECECGDPIPTPLGLDESYHNFKVFLLSSNRLEYTKIYNLINTPLVVDKFIHNITRDIVSHSHKTKLATILKLLELNNLRNNNGRSISHNTTCEGHIETPRCD